MEKFPLINNEYVNYLLFLQQIQKLMFFDTTFPSELNRLILRIMIDDIIVTLDGADLRDKAKQYKKMNYTIYYGNCCSPADHTWENIKGVWRNTCQCKFGVYDESLFISNYIIYQIDAKKDDEKDIQRRYQPDLVYSYSFEEGNYILYRHYCCYDRTHVIESTVSPERSDMFFKGIVKYFHRQTLLCKLIKY
jgi:hypothetical protein